MCFGFRDPLGTIALFFSSLFPCPSLCCSSCHPSMNVRAAADAITKIHIDAFRVQIRIMKYGLVGFSCSVHSGTQINVPMSHVIMMPRRKKHYHP
jgi:hypothetical protein